VKTREVAWHLGDPGCPGRPSGQTLTAPASAHEGWLGADDVGSKQLTLPLRTRSGILTGSEEGAPGLV